MKGFTKEERILYQRHFSLPTFGEQGQRKLKNARALVVGAGGLGSPIALYLCAAGIGKLGLVDSDTVEANNLHRQILYRQQDVGRSKLNSARDALLARNPFVDIQLHETRLNAENAVELFAEYDLILDGTDNYSTRYLTNDACFFLRKPLVFGSVSQFEGRVSVFFAEKGPCYRCLYPNPPPSDLVPSCAEGGVLGVLPGIVGTLQALEAIKLIVGLGESLIGNLLLVDTLTMQFKKLRIQKDEDCPLCGKEPTIKRLESESVACPTETIPPDELRSRLETDEKLLLIDVRDPVEFAAQRLPGAKLIPLGELERRTSELDEKREIVLYCKSGARSARGCEILRRKGFRSAKNLRGGIDAYALLFFSAQ